jgi:hypothetical protein
MINKGAVKSKKYPTIMLLNTIKIIPIVVIYLAESKNARYIKGKE